jgi:SAM-dependent methyltransferase
MNRPANLLEKIDWETLDIEVSHQQRNREVHAPAISLYRWWARRPHALIGELLDAAGPGEILVSDPFSGGGTVALEASRRGLSVYAQDLHPWPTAGLATALDGVNAEELCSAGEEWLASLHLLRAEHYAAACAEHADEGGEILTAFWVRQARCPDCERAAYLFPYSLITLASRRKEEKFGFFGCTACGYVTRSDLKVQDRRCSRCSQRLADPSVPLLPGGVHHCPATGCGGESAAFALGFDWRVVLVQRSCGSAAHFGRPGAAEVAALEAPPAREVPAGLREPIPSGLETRRLHRGGLRSWADLYPPRQLDSLLAAAAALDSLDADPAIRARLRLVLCGAGEMAGYASRWDRFYPKAFEATANHRFNLTALSAETNLLAERGRGTLPRRLAHSVRAARWAAEAELPTARSAASWRRTRLDAVEPDSPTVVRGSSSRQLLPDDSVDLVLTDPPYFNDVQYAELGSLFLAWAKVSGLLAAGVHIDFRSEAVANSARGSDTERYCQLLRAVLGETARTLKPGGRAVITYHNSSGRAWWGLSRALGRAGFYVHALAVAHAENESDHSKRGRRAFSHDLVIECRLVAPVGSPVIAATGEGAQARQLIAAGRMVADHAAELASGALGRTRSYRTFAAGYRAHLGTESSTYIDFGSGAKGGEER